MLSIETIPLQYTLPNFQAGVMAGLKIWQLSTKPSPGLGFVDYRRSCIRTHAWKCNRVVKRVLEALGVFITIAI